MGIFEKNYAGLNAAQKQAVDSVEGPVMVIAGPGTGKTELLSLRVANILKKTDALAENILCLTFTESGAAAMRERLAHIMGKDAYRVAVHTFHGFGSEIISKYGEYFYSGANFRPANELATHQILTTIFGRLPHNNPLSSKMNGDYSYLKYVQNTISDFKKSGLTPDEIQRLMRHNQGFLEFAEPIIAEFFSVPMHKSMLEKITVMFDTLSAYQSLPTDVANFEPLSDLFLAQLSSVIEVVLAEKKVTALTAWRNVWLEKNKKNHFVFKDTKRSKKLLAASLIYADYLHAMQSESLYDYDDMILRLVHALEVFPELKFNLQEQYQYILVDEFQDTNGAQMRILLSLGDNPVYENRPNILVVGDDDQAIYSFQGAELSNLLTFKKRFQKPLVVALRENYRSAPLILTHARDIITQGQDRLENALESIDKTPLPVKSNAKAEVSLKEYADPQNEYNEIAEALKILIESGTKPSNIAVLARHHKDIQSLLPYLAYHNITFTYEHQDNVLESPPIVILIKLARVLVLLEQGRIDEADTALPELLSHPAWGCRPQELWQTSLTAHKENKTWLEVMSQSQGHLKDVASFIVDTAYTQKKRTLEENIDCLYGMEKPKDTNYPFMSPLGKFFFSTASAEVSNPYTLLENIHSLSLMRQQLKDYRPEAHLTLTDFVEFVDKLRAARIRLNLHGEAAVNENAVSVMTAHKAKGREFDTVFIVNASDSTWGSKSRGRPNRLAYPANMPIAPPGTSSDERLRLFFVAMTRAKRRLFISYATHNETGKPTLRADFLHSSLWKAETQDELGRAIQKRQTVAEISWRQAIGRPESDLRTALAPVLSSYRLSVTHMNSYLDIVRGGPQNFLLYNLLRFPRSLPPQAALGSAIHRTLKQAHDHFAATKERRPLEDVLYDFEANLKSQRLTTSDYSHQVQKGTDALQAYLAKTYDSFSSQQIGERNFHHQNLVIGEAKVTGIVDVINPNKLKKLITLTDYKTGKASLSWAGKTDYEKIKLHQYKQQLLFYKLLLDASSDYRSYKVTKGYLEFIEPDEHGEFMSLELDYNKEDFETFKKLVEAVWRRIMAADFPDTSHYPQNYKGVISFENDLIKD